MPSPAEFAAPGDVASEAEASDPSRSRTAETGVYQRPVSAYFGDGYYFEDFGYDGPYVVGPDGRSHRVCRHFLQGRCTWGDSCRFSHEVGNAVTDYGPDALPGPQVDALDGRPLTSHARGYPPFQGGSESLDHQQAALQSRRHAVLDAALRARFQIRQIQPTTDTTTSVQRRKGQVTLTTLANAPPIMLDVLEGEELTAELERLLHDPRVQASGLHYVVGETSVFWSMMRRWHVDGRTGNATWDALLDAAHRGLPVACMFFRCSVGCAAGRCAFTHTATPLEAPTSDHRAAQQPDSTTVAPPEAPPPDETAAVAEGW